MAEALSVLSLTCQVNNMLGNQDAAVCTPERASASVFVECCSPVCNVLRPRSVRELNDDERNMPHDLRACELVSASGSTS